MLFLDMTLHQYSHDSPGDAASIIQMMLDQNSGLALIRQVPVDGGSAWFLYFLLRCEQGTLPSCMSMGLVPGNDMLSALGMLKESCLGIWQ